MVATPNGTHQTRPGGAAGDGVTGEGAGAADNADREHYDAGDGVSFDELHGPADAG
jgi:hypothetical protein